MDVPLLLVLLGILGRSSAQAEQNSSLHTVDVLLIHDLNRTNASDLTLGNGTRLTAFANLTAWNETDLRKNGTADGEAVTLATEELVRKILDGYKNLLSKSYWDQRMHDPYFLSEMLVPFTAGIAVSWLLVLLVCTVKMCCYSSAKKKLRSKSKKMRKIKKSDQTNKDGPQWMLLERDSSDEEL